MLTRLSLYTLLLCLVPLFTLAIGWNWQENMPLTSFDQLLYFITETGSTPYAILTCGFFALLYFIVIPNKKQAIAVIVVMAFSIILTQGIKSGLKTAFAEPRPFISALNEYSQETIDYFYDLPEEQRADIVQYYYSLENVPHWLVSHRAKEVGYSFPSGHTIFAATWLLLAAGFSRLLSCGTSKLKWITVFIGIWAILMLISRLRLGMHYPIDLLVSAFIAWVVHIGLFTFLDKKAIFNKEIQQKCG